MAAFTAAGLSPAEWEGAWNSKTSQLRDCNAQFDDAAAEGNFGQAEFYDGECDVLDEAIVQLALNAPDDQKESATAAVATAVPVGAARDAKVAELKAADRAAKLKMVEGEEKDDRAAAPVVRSFPPVTDLAFACSNLIDKITTKVQDLKSKPDSFDGADALLAEVKGFAGKFLKAKGAGEVTAKNFNDEYRGPFAALTHKIGMAQKPEAAASAHDDLEAQLAGLLD